MVEYYQLHSRYSCLDIRTPHKLRYRHVLAGSADAVQSGQYTPSLELHRNWRRCAHSEEPTSILSLPFVLASDKFARIEVAYPLAFPIFVGSYSHIVIPASCCARRLFAERPLSLRKQSSCALSCFLRNHRKFLLRAYLAIQSVHYVCRCSYYCSEGEHVG